MIVALSALPAAASAREYPAWGETEWAFGSKRECCNEAIALAQEHSAMACHNSGGEPRPLRGGVQRRGFCSWESSRDDYGGVIFRCKAEASVPCR